MPPFAYEAYVRGELALTRGEPDEAIALFELATAAPDEDAYLLSRLAYAQALAGQVDRARQTLAEAERVDPCSEALWLTRAQLASQARDLTRAAIAYGKASACAPDSVQGPLGMATVLEAQGERTQAIEVLERFARTRPLSPRAPEAAVELALRVEGGAELAHAFEGWLASLPPRLRTLERAVEWALEHDRPALAQRLYAHALGGQNCQLEARMYMALGDRERLRALLARVPAEQLGGHAQTAELALWAFAFERAELEAGSLLLAGPSDEAHGLRARARLALQRADEAVEDLSHVRDPALRRDLALELLADVGSRALSAELSASETRAQ